jgi:hypothetical protein
MLVVVLGGLFEFRLLPVGVRAFLVGLMRVPFGFVCQLPSCNLSPLGVLFPDFQIPVFISGIMVCGLVVRFLGMRVSWRGLQRWLAICGLLLRALSVVLYLSFLSFFLY